MRWRTGSLSPLTFFFRYEPSRVLLGKEVLSLLKLNLVFPSPVQVSSRTPVLLKTSDSQSHQSLPTLYPKLTAMISPDTPYSGKQLSGRSKRVPLVPFTPTFRVTGLQNPLLFSSRLIADGESYPRIRRNHHYVPHNSTPFVHHIILVVLRPDGNDRRHPSQYRLPVVHRIHERWSPPRQSGSRDRSPTRESLKHCELTLECGVHHS